MSKIFLYGLSFMLLFSNLYAGVSNFKAPTTKSNQKEKAEFNNILDFINKEDDLENKNFNKQMYSNSMQQLPINKSSIRSSIQQQPISNSTPQFSINQKNSDTQSSTYILPSYNEEREPNMSYNPYSLDKNTYESVKNPHKSVQVIDRNNINKNSSLNSNIIKSIQQENKKNSEINSIMKSNNLQESNGDDNTNFERRYSNLQENNKKNETNFEKKDNKLQNSKMNSIIKKENIIKNQDENAEIEKNPMNNNKLKKELALKLIESINSIKSEIKGVKSQLNEISEEQRINRQKANEFIKQKGAEVDALYDGIEKAGLILIEHSDGSSTLTTKSKINIKKSLSKNKFVQRKAQFNKILTSTNTIYPSKTDYKNNITTSNW